RYADASRSLRPRADGAIGERCDMSRRARRVASEARAPRSALESGWGNRFSSGSGSYDATAVPTPLGTSIAVRPDESPTDRRREPRNHVDLAPSIPMDLPGQLLAKRPDAPCDSAQRLLRIG